MRLKRLLNLLGQEGRCLRILPSVKEGLMVAITLDICQRIGFELSHVFRCELHQKRRHVAVEILNLCRPGYGADVGSLMVNPGQCQL